MFLMNLIFTSDGNIWISQAFEVHLIHDYGYKYWKLRINVAYGKLQAAWGES